MRELSINEVCKVAGGTDERTDVTVDYTSNDTATVSVWGHAGELLMTFEDLTIDQAEDMQDAFNESRDQPVNGPT